MTSGLTQLRRLEQRMTYVRWFGAVCAAVGVATKSSYPDGVTQRNAWVLVVVLALGSLVIWGVSERTSERDHHRLGVYAFAFDVVVILGLVWTFGYETPYVAWALLLILPLEGALRYQMRGAVGGALGVVAFFVPQSLHRADLLGTPFDTGTFLFVACLAVLIAGVTGSMANEWRAQSRALEEQGLMLAEADELKDRFLAITSHEIRGPLTAIIAGTETVRKKKDALTPEQHDRLLEIVSSQGKQLARLVDDLLITTQIQSGQLALQTDWADLQQTIQHGLEGAASRRRQHQLELYVEPLQCEMDASRVGQIVRNLVENAYKYTPERTRVAVTAKREPGGFALQVEDSGPGIPQNKREQLFEAFSRIEETAAGREGVGLGLYVVSQLVAAMNGRIDVSSSQRGATFTIHVPCETRTSSVPARLELVPDERNPAQG